MPTATGRIGALRGQGRRERDRRGDGGSEQHGDREQERLIDRARRAREKRFPKQRREHSDARERRGDGERDCRGAPRSRNLNASVSPSRVKPHAHAFDNT